MSKNLEDDFGPAVPVLVSRDVKESLEFFERLGITSNFMLEDGSYGGLTIGSTSLHFYKDLVKEHAEWSSCRINMESLDEIYARCKDQGVVHPNGDLSEKPWGTREFAILDESGVCYTFVLRLD